MHWPGRESPPEASSALDARGAARRLSPRRHEGLGGRVLTVCAGRRPESPWCPGLEQWVAAPTAPKVGDAEGAGAEREALQQREGAGDTSPLPPGASWPGPGGRVTTCTTDGGPAGTIPSKERSRRRPSRLRVERAHAGGYCGDALVYGKSPGWGACLESGPYVRRAGTPQGPGPAPDKRRRLARTYPRCRAADVRAGALVSVPGWES